MYIIGGVVLTAVLRIRIRIRSGSAGSTCFWASWIRILILIHQSEVWIRIQIWILLTLSKNSKINLFCDFFYRILRNYDAMTL
jgi:hypothetical protein